MKEQIEKRKAELITEYETGQRMLTELDQQRANLEQTLLRIAGAIQVCDEFLTQPGAPAAEQDTNNGDNC